jgi:methyltransferase-like protein/2-polyprenyl-3-methyl-5-hydroxy-6-metoxy-1,4-benzoquinol methylase
VEPDGEPAALTSPPAGPTAYDELPYLGLPYAQSHPDRLATLATVFGMSPAPVGRCRVLEFGCGDGGNLIPMAYGLPESRFVGIDLAPTAIAKGRRTIDALGLTNIELLCGDLAEADPPPGGPFDYVVALGVYSWVPEAVADRLLAVAKALLTPQGVAFVSYNALPGGHARAMVREILRFEVRDIASPRERVARARALARTLLDGQEGATGHRLLLAGELERTLARSDAAIAHDDLAPVNRPVAFHEFAARAAAHGLQYLAEADFFEMHAGAAPPEVHAALEARTTDIVTREQYLDFLKCRMYRQTLLCHADVRLDRDISAETVATLRVASAARPTDPDANLDDHSPVEFSGPTGSAQTDDPRIKRTLARLAEQWPRSVPFADLVGPRDEELAHSLLAAYAADVVRLHAHEPRFTTTPGPRPRASALARLEAQAGAAVTTLRHTTVTIDDEAGRFLLTILDGTRDLPGLATALGDAPMAKLEAKLAELGRLALLEA